jgi:iron complex transport system substrate-binding protein
LPVETVLQKAKHADLWIGTASFTTLSDLEKADHRYTLFDAFIKENVFHYNAKVSPGLGSFYLEEGYLRADFILADLIKIAHPELLPKHTFIYHAKLNAKR